MITPSMKTGTFAEDEVVFFVYYGSSNSPRDRERKMFLNEDQASEFFKKKQKQNMYVEVYVQTIECLRTVKRLA